MDHKRIIEFEEKCIQEQPPACNTTCPVHVDARGFIAEIKAGRFAEALNIYRKSVPFPGIIGRICDHPCQAACKRGEAGAAIAVAELEKACVQLIKTKRPKLTPQPSKQKKVAVIGAGLSGLTAAYELAKKGYQVTILEAKGALGGRIRQYAELDLPSRVITEDLLVLIELGVVIQLNCEVGRDQALSAICEDYQAVYLGTGNASPQFSLPVDELGKLIVNPVTYATGREGVFAGGTICREGSYSPIGSVSDGRRAAVSIDRYLQGISLTAVREHEGPYETRLFTSTKGVEPLPAVSLGEGVSFYSEQEAIQEAARCLQCQCLECVKVCEYMVQFKGYPKKFIRQINHNLKMIKGKHEANPLINSCSLCGLCGEVCPEGLNLGELIQEARAEMVTKGKMPPSAHDFPLRDMEFSNGEQCVLMRHQPGFTTSSHLFFPGCQLGASAPEHIERAYAYLTEKMLGGVGLMLRCCGAPAEWSGRTEKFLVEMQQIKENWQELGRPRVIFACTTCYQMFKKHLPEVELISLWELYQQYGLPEVSGANRPALVAVHDACTSRHEGQIHETVRELLRSLGCTIEELVTSRGKTECCGYGGMMQFANRELADNVVQRRINQSPADYVAYCAICRDNFAAKGKRTYHLLDLIYGEADATAPAKRGPGYSERRENRVKLKNRLLQNVWGERVAEEKATFAAIKLILADAVQQKMEQRLILVEDIQRVIEYAERTGNKLFIEDTGHILACHKPMEITYWVEYTHQQDGFMVHNTYSHRMEVKGNH